MKKTMTAVLFTTALGFAGLAMSPPALAHADEGNITVSSSDAEREAAGCHKLDPDHPMGKKFSPIYQSDEGDPKKVLKCLDDVQKAHAKTVVQIGEEVGATPDEIVTGLMTTIQETMILNLGNDKVDGSMDMPNDIDFADHDSVGMFQQRASLYPLEMAQNPEDSARLFFLGLMRAHKSGAVTDDMGKGDAAQCVQGSQFPDAYNDDEDLAKEIYEAYKSDNPQVSLSDDKRAQVDKVLDELNVGAQCNG